MVAIESWCYKIAVSKLVSCAPLTTELTIWNTKSSTSTAIALQYKSSFRYA